MVILCNILLIFVNLIHFFKHFKCRNRKKSEEEEFGVYPILFIFYSLFQTCFSMYLTIIYICDIAFDTQITHYDNHYYAWNSMNIIPKILLYPFNIDKQFTYFIPRQKFEFNGINISININSMYIIIIFIVFLTYIFEGFLHFYRYYSIYITHKYLRNASFNTILKYYCIYIITMSILLLLSFLLNIIFNQNYFIILTVICHLFFCIYCTNKQIKILRLSTKNSFNSQHLKIL
eukprot:458439_1